VTVVALFLTRIVKKKYLTSVSHVIIQNSWQILKIQNVFNLSTFGFQEIPTNNVAPFAKKKPQQKMEAWIVPANVTDATPPLTTRVSTKTKIHFVDRPSLV